MCRPIWFLCGSSASQWVDAVAVRFLLARVRPGLQKHRFCSALRLRLESRPGTSGVRFEIQLHPVLRLSIVCVLCAGSMDAPLDITADLLSLVRLDARFDVATNEI